MAQGKPGRPRKEEPSVSIDADFTRPDPLEVKGKQDGMRYRWIRNNPDNINVKQAAGWEIVKDNPKEQVAENQSGDNTRRFGDLILAKMPERKAQARNQFYLQQARALIDSARRKLRGGKGYSIESEIK